MPCPSIFSLITVTSCVCACVCVCAHVCETCVHRTGLPGSWYFCTERAGKLIKSLCDCEMENVKEFRSTSISSCLIILYVA